MLQTNWVGFDVQTASDATLLWTAKWSTSADMVVKLSQTEVSQLFKNFKIELKQTVKSGDLRQVKADDEFECTVG